MAKARAIYKLVGFYENWNNTGKLKLKLASADCVICCNMEDIDLIAKYLSIGDNQYIRQLIKMRY